MDGNKRARRRHRRGIEILKSILILLLSLTAIYLTMLALDYSKVSWAPLQGILSLFRPETEQAPENTFSPGQSSISPKPVRMAVCDGVDRFASQYDTQQTDQMFDELSILLTESLASAAAPRQITEEDWQDALQAPGVWFDFLGAVPLDALYAWLGDGGSNPALTHAARRIVVALDDGGKVRLSYHNESDGLYYACDTTVVYTGHMDMLISGYGSNGVSFVFELDDTSGYESLDPYVLLSAGALQPPVYHVSNPLSDISDSMLSTLQQAVSFQPQSNSVYPVANGIRIREGRETLEISGDGTVTYHAGDSDAYRYPISGGENGSLFALTEATWRLAADTVGRWCGTAQLYLIGAEEQDDGSIQLSYGYSLNGAEVALPGGNCAARFSIRDGQITDYVLYFRSYEQTGQTSLVMRERQAAAALDALDPEGRELVLCYSDTGEDSVQAGWIAR